MRRKLAMPNINPLLLTLKLNSEAQAFFDGLRQANFPADRNYLDAHVMLFHQLPQNEMKLTDDMVAIAKEYKPITVNVTGISSIGTGVAYKLESEELQQLHKQLQKQWLQWLIPQDKQKLWPHITIQNKVTPNDARYLLNKLSVDFKSFSIQATGLTLWEYMGGPWTLIEEFAFLG
jgi:2'-5' RNA ligase